MAETVEQAGLLLFKSKEDGQQTQLSYDAEQSANATVSVGMKASADEFLLAEEVDTQEETDDESDEVK